MGSFLSKDLTTSQNLASAALDYTTTFARPRKIENILIHFSVAISEIVKITLDNANGANYDTVLDQVELVAEQDYVFRPQGQLNLKAGDELRIQCTNSNLTGTAYVTVKSSEIQGR